MPLRLLNFLIAYFTGEKRVILRQNDQGAEEEEQHQGEEGEEEQQNRMETGAIVPKRYEIDGGQEHDNERICKYLPEELMIESILTRLPAQTLAKCCSVSKLWYNSILCDSRFSVIHNIQNKDKVFLVFNLLNVSRDRAYFFSLSEGEKVGIGCLANLCIDSVNELGGFCNGLVCMTRKSAPNDAYAIINVLSLSRTESLVLTYLPPPTVEYINLGHGFGLDSLSQAYKVVILFISKINNELLCMVTTLGTNSWRKIITSTLDISLPLGSSRFPTPMVTRVSGMLSRQATFCGGHLFWRTKNGVGNDKTEMLLSFDLHSEKIHFIRLPTEFTLTTETNERQHLVIDHLLEFKGYPCIARSERILLSNKDHCGHRCNYQTGVCCCCCCKVYMYILKDKDKQIWIREETFDVQIKGQKGLSQPPLCWYFDTFAAMPPTRVLAFSGQVVLYWFNVSYVLQFARETSQGG